MRWSPKLRAGACQPCAEWPALLSVCTAMQVGADYWVAMHAGKAGYRRAWHGARPLLANIAAMYAVYHGPDGLDKMATRIKGLASILAVGKPLPFTRSSLRATQHSLPALRKVPCAPGHSTGIVLAMTAARFAVFCADEGPDKVATFMNWLA